MMDVLQIASLILYTACTALAFRLRLHSGYWLAFFMVIAHHAIYYAFVVAQNAGLLSGVPTMSWGLAVRLHLAIVILGYLLHGKTK